MALPTRARAAEEAGISAVFVTDHPAPPSTWLERGGHATLDPFVALSYVAASTSRLRLHTNLIVLAYRHPLTTAKSVASLDALSEGRVILGVGVGYLRGEFEALDVQLGRRAALADAALATMRRAWTGDPVGKHGAVVLPTPVQQPHPPIWVGGNSIAAMRRAVEYGNGWSPMPSPKAAAGALGTPGIESTDELGSRIARLHQLAAEAGRTDPLDVAVIVPSLSGFATGPTSAAEVLDEIGELVAAGGTALVMSLPDQDWDSALDRVACDVLPTI